MVSVGTIVDAQSTIIKPSTAAKSLQTNLKVKKTVPQGWSSNKLISSNSYDIASYKDVQTTSTTIYNINGPAIGDIHAGSELSITGGTPFVISDGSLIYTDNRFNDTISSSEYPESVVRSGISFTPGNDLILNLGGYAPNADVYLEPIYCKDASLLDGLMIVNNRKSAYLGTGYATHEVRREKVWVKADSSGNIEVRFTGIGALNAIKISAATKFAELADTIIFGLGDSLETPYRNEHKAPLLRAAQARDANFFRFDSCRDLNPLRAVKIVDLSINGITTAGQVSLISSNITPRLAEHNYKRKVAIISTGANDSGTAAQIYAGFVSAKNAYWAVGITEVFIRTTIPRIGGIQLMNDVAQLSRYNWQKDGFAGIIDSNNHPTWTAYPDGLGDNPNYRDEQEDGLPGGVGLHLDEPGLAIIGNDYIGSSSLFSGFGVGIRASVVSSSQINVFWNDSVNPDVTSYNLRINGTNVITGLTSLSYPVKDLTPNTTYTFEVQAVTPNSVSVWSAPVQATTSTKSPPNAPNSVTTSVVSSSQINVFWNVSTSSDVIGYNLRINGSTVIPSITYLSYPVKDLTPNTTYTFEVQTVSSDGISNWTTPVNATTNPTAATPTGISPKVVSSTQIDVFWNQNPAGDNVTGYNLRVNGTTVIPNITYLSYAVKNLTPSTVYSFEVQAINSLGVSNWSAPVNATTDSSVPNAPTNVRGNVASNSQINVFWDASNSPNVTSYNLRVNGSTIISNITYLSWAVRNLTPNTTYSFEVQAVNSAGELSNWTTPINAITNPLTPLNAPSNVRGNAVSSTQINVFWDGSNSPNIASYNLRINGSAVISNITYLSWAVTGLTPSTTYSFEVQAVNSSGVASAWSNPVNITTNPIAPPPNAPTNIRASGVSTSQINVFWDGSTSPNVTSYNLRVNGAAPITGITYLSWAVRNLAPNTTYTFEVQAVNSSGVPSAWSTPVNATTMALPSPLNLRASVVSASQINLFWDGVSTPGVSSYNLRVNGSTIISNITYLSWAVTGLTPNTTYSFEVRSVDVAGNVSNWSNPVQATTAASSQPEIFSMFDFLNGFDFLNLNNLAIGKRNNYSKGLF